MAVALNSPVVSEMNVRANLKPFLRPGLDVLFIALNPPQQSNANGHYFSGRSSRFFKLLYLSGLITIAIPQSEADVIVFGTNQMNYHGCAFGVVDLVDDHVETNSTLVRHTQTHADVLLDRIVALKPRSACVIHSGVRASLNESGKLIRPLDYGWCGPILAASETQFILNYFPNGNSIPDEPKLRIFADLRNRL